jgi:hypothetical protein
MGAAEGHEDETRGGGSRARAILRGVMTGPEPLTAEQQAWLVANESRWKRARRIVGSHADLDLRGVYRVLRNLEKSPSERLRAALLHGRLFGLQQR